jgi:hypothetical protein
VSAIVPMGKINVVKGSGPQFDVHYTKSGTMEMWKTEDGKYRMIYTGNPEPNYGIGTEKEFKYEDKFVKWVMVDYIEVGNMMNLMPMYGTSLTSYSYN